MTGPIGILILLACILAFIWLCYQGYAPALMAPIMAMVVLLTARLPVYEGMTGTYMTGATNFIKNYFLMFAAGSIFAALMTSSGAARTIGWWLAKLAKKFPGHEKYAAMWCATAIGFAITYGGVMIFVAFFTIIAIVKELYEELDVPWRYYSCVVFGTATLSMTMVPGSPSANNAVAAGWLGTNAMSGPMLGIIATVLSIIVGHFFFSYECKKFMAKGEGFLPDGERIKEKQFDQPPIMNLGLAVIPSILLWITLNILKQSVTIACFVGIIAALVIYGLILKRFTIQTAIDTMTRGATQAIPAGFTPALIIGFGSCIASTPAYKQIIEALLNLPGAPEYQVVIAVAIAAAMSGSPSGGLNIALENLSGHFLEIGMNPGVLHRISCVASGSLDSLPSCATLINELNQACLTHKQAYYIQGVMSTVWPLICSFLLAFLAATFGIC